MSRPGHPSGPSRLQTTAALLTAAAAAFAMAARSTAQPAAPAVQAPGLEVLAQHGGGVEVAVADGDVLYVAVGSRIEAYDVADPARPVLLGSSPPLPSLVQNLAIDGPRLYATVYRGGLRAFAIDRGPVPRPLGALQGVAGSVVDLHIVGDAAILGDHAAGLIVVDVADPVAPRHVATTAVLATRDGDETLEVRAVGRRGSNLAVVAAGSAGHQLVLYDVSDAASLVELGRTRVDASNAFGSEWLGDHVYTDSGYGLHPVDVSDPAAPRALEPVARPEGARVGSVHAGGDRLYQWADLGQETGLVEYALDDPARPTLAAIHRDGPWGGVLAAGQRIYSWTNVVRPPGSAALGIYARANDGTLQKRGGIHLSLGVVDAAAVGSTLWFTGDRALLAVDPADPRRTPTRRPTGWGVGPIAASDGRIYVASGREGLHALDVSDPAAPRDLPGIPLAPPAVELRNVAVEGDRGYAVAWRGRGGLPSDLMIFDAGRAEGPVVLGTLPVAVGWNGLGTMLPVDDVLLVSSDAGVTRREIVLVDVRDASAPVELHRLPMVDHVWALARGPGGAIYAGTDTALIRFELTSAPPFLVERARWRAGEEGAEREVRAVAVAGDAVHVLLTYGPGPSTSSRAADASGYEAVVRTLRAGPDGALRVVDDVPVPVSFFYSATYDLVATASHLGVVGSSAGFTILGRVDARPGPAPPRGLYVPWAAR